MMRELHEAVALHVQAPTTEVFKSRTLWRIKGKRGVFRGVARKGRSGLKAAAGNIVAVHSADLLDEFRLDKETTAELREAFPGDPCLEDFICAVAQLAMSQPEKAAEELRVKAAEIMAEERGGDDAEI